MSFADCFLFCFNVLAGTIFLCQVVWFSIAGLREHLADRKRGKDIREADRKMLDGVAK